MSLFTLVRPVIFLSFFIYVCCSPEKGMLGLASLVEVCMDSDNEEADESQNSQVVVTFEIYDDSLSTDNGAAAALNRQLKMT